MKLLIKKNHRRPCWQIPLGLPHVFSVFKESKLSKTFMFTESCLYDLKNENQSDINKLFGFSIGLHYINSVRFGWRPNLKNSTIEILKYEYNDKVRNFKSILELDLNKFYRFEIKYDGFGFVSYSIFDINDVCLANTLSIPILGFPIIFGYRLGLYFGGNEKAPQDITIYKR